MIREPDGWADGPEVPSVREARLRGGSDALGVVVFVVVVVLVASVIWNWSPNDLTVYHLAVAHVLTDDVYQFGYPDLPFTYPPTALIALAPSGIGMPVARSLMFVCSVVAVVVTVRLTVRTAAPGTTWDRPGPIGLFSALTLLTWPFLFGSVLGQIAPVVMGLSAVGLLGRESRWNGVWLGAAVGIKLTPAAFWLYWWGVGRWRAVLVSMGTFLAWTAAAALVMPGSSWWYFGQGGLFRVDHNYAYLSNQALTGIGARLGLDAAAGRVGALVVSAAALLLAVGVARRLQKAGWSAAAVGLVGIWSGVAAPLAWTHAFVWWAPLAIAVWLCGRTRADLAVASLVYLAPLLVLLGPLGAPPPFGALEQVQGATYALTAVAVTAYLFWRVRSATGPAPVSRLVSEGNSLTP